MQRNGFSFLLIKSLRIAARAAFYDHIRKVREMAESIGDGRDSELPDMRRIAVFQGLAG